MRNRRSGVRMIDSKTAKFFRDMRKNGIAYRRKLEREGRSPSEFSLYGGGRSQAFKFWAIAEWLSASDILVDALPDEKDLDEFLDTFRKAGILYIVLTGSAAEQADILNSRNCKIGEETKVFRRETQLYHGDLEIVKGIRVLI